jgi:hypothetical protein
MGGLLNRLIVNLPLYKLLFLLKKLLLLNLLLAVLSRLLINTGNFRNPCMVYVMLLFTGITYFGKF